MTPRDYLREALTRRGRVWGSQNREVIRQVRQEMRHVKQWVSVRWLTSRPRRAATYGGYLTLPPNAQ